MDGKLEKQIWCPQCWKWYFRVSTFQNFLGEHAPRPPPWLRGLTTPCLYSRLFFPNQLPTSILLKALCICVQYIRLAWTAWLQNCVLLVAFVKAPKKYYSGDTSLCTYKILLIFHISLSFLRESINCSFNISLYNKGTVNEHSVISESSQIWVYYYQIITHFTEFLFCSFYLHWSARVDFRCLDISSSSFSRVTVIWNRSRYKTAVRSFYNYNPRRHAADHNWHLRPTEETMVQGISHYFLVH